MSVLSTLEFTSLPHAAYQHAVSSSYRISVIVVACGQYTCGGLLYKRSVLAFGSARW
jgi:hypothetical protein